MAPRPANSPVEVSAAAAETVPVSTKTAGFRYSPPVLKAIERCWEKVAPPSEWNLDREEFFEAIKKSVAHRFASASPDDKTIEAYLATLQLRDLALARACSLGNAAAWDYFVAQFRPELYRAARAIAGDANSRELADSLYADLYGLRESGGQRKSLFDYFHGRSKLSTWLRAVLAQRHVDEIRRARKTESIEDESGAEIREVGAAERPPHTVAADFDPERPKYLAALQAALAAVLGALDPRDRLRLAYYYIDGRTLSEIGRLLGEHEATVSRKLDRARRDVRDGVVAALRENKNWTDAEVKLCFEYARGEWPFDLEKSLRPSASAEESAAQPDAASAAE
jgi:RNA polymerase sigma factor (sigma-70 family)